jgi:dihydropteroate synthase
MGEKLLFLTGRLAHDSLCQELESLEKRDFEYEVRDLGLKVAALMTADMIARRLDDVSGFDRILVPGLCGGDVEGLAARVGIPVERGPKDLKDLPEFFGGARRAVDLSRHSVLIFAEIVDAPHVSVEAVVARAERYRRDGADVIDLGCLPGTPFDHLEDCIAALRERGFRVSVDSLEVDELLRAGRAGADYLLSLHVGTLHVADEVASTPVLIPEVQGDLDSLVAAVEHMERAGRPYFADAILDPIHFGFTESIVRFHELRRRLPDAPVMMGVGNITELTDADTSGINALLFGIISELGIDAVLATEVSRHAASAVREADAARRMMYAAHADRRLPRGYSAALMTHHEKKPFTHDDGEIAAIAAAVRDRNFRIQVSESGLHVYNRDGHHRATDPFALYPNLDVDSDGSHAFYLGVELGRAQIAWQLGKRYLQDNELEWGALRPPDAPPEIDPETGYQRPGETLKRRRRGEKKPARGAGAGRAGTGGEEEAG